MQRQGRAIAAERPGAGAALMDKPGGAVCRIHGSSWQAGRDHSLPQAAPAENALNFPSGKFIHFRDRGAARQAPGADQRLSKSQSLLPAAFKAGAMAACQSGRLIQEEEFGIMARPHERVLAALEGKPADDPALAGPLPALQCAVFSMETAAPVSHEAAPFGHCVQQPERISPVLERHGAC